MIFTRMNLHELHFPGCIHSFFVQLSTWTMSFPWHVQADAHESRRAAERVNISFDECFAHSR